MSNKTTLEAELEAMTEKFRKSIASIGFKLPIEEIEPDNVHNPGHYIIPGTGLEVIDIIEGILTEEQFQGYCYGNVIKYILRAPKKGGKEYFEKATVYLEWLIRAIDDAEEADNKAYATGYEDGYDQGCMDVVGEDLGTDCAWGEAEE